MSTPINRANTSREELIRVAKKCGFRIREGKKHTIVFIVSAEGEKEKVTIPRHGKKINKQTVAGILKWFVTMGCDIEIR